MLQPDDITSLFANAYYEAARANADMRAVAEVLEELRAPLSAEKDIYKVWKNINLHIGKSMGNTMRFELLHQLRRQFIDLFYSNIRTEIKSALEKDKAKGWAAWLMAFADALNHWKSEIFELLVQDDYHFAKANRKDFELYQQGVEFILLERWDHSYPMFLNLLSKEVLTDEQVARLEVTAGQIKLYHLNNFKEALQHYEAAKSLCPGAAFAERGMAEYYIQQKDFEKAREYLRDVMGTEGEDYDNFIKLGDSHAAEGDLTAAEEWYKHAKRLNPGAPLASTKLIQLYGKSSLFEKRADRLEQEAEVVIKLEPDQTFITYIDVGYAYQQNKKYDAAETWFKKAIESNDKIPLGPVYLAYLYQEQEQYEKAEETYLDTLKMAPDYFDALWGLAKLYEVQQKWDEAIKYYELSLS